MTAPRTRKPKARARVKPAPDPKVLLPKLRARLEKERSGKDRWQKRMLRASAAAVREVVGVLKRA